MTLNDLLKQIHTYCDNQYKACGMYAETEQTDVEKVRALMIGYAYHYWDDGYTTLGIEVPFTFPVMDAETDKPIKDASHGGIVDAIRTKSDRLFFQDTKTIKGRPSPMYLDMLMTAAQPMQYAVAALQEGLDLDGFIWDVVSKPGIARKKLSKKAVAEIENGTYEGFPLREEYKGEEKETPVLYGMRLFVDVTEDPTKYFSRHLVPLTKERLYRFAEDQSKLTKSILHSKENPDTVYRNRNACGAYNKKCEFHQLCALDPSVDIEEFYQPKKSYGRGNGTPKKGSLSHSRMSVYQTCQMKWKYSYVDKIAAVYKPYDSALAIGTMVHHCVELFLATRWGTEKITLTNELKGEN